MKSQTPFMVEQMVGGVDFLVLPNLDLGWNSKLTSNDMADIRHQSITVNGDNDPDT